MKSTFISIALMGMALAATAAHADLFPSVVGAMSVKTTDGATESAWKNGHKIDGVKWIWTDYKPGADQVRRVGKAKIASANKAETVAGNTVAGDTTVTVSGSKDVITDIEISINQAKGSMDMFGNGAVTQLKTSCDSNAKTDGAHFYKFVKNGFKPLYISYQSNVAAGMTTRDIFHVYSKMDDMMNVFPSRCDMI